MVVGALLGLGADSVTKVYCRQDDPAKEGLGTVETL